MSPKQERKYLFEWGKVRKYFREQGLDPKLADAKRHQLHKKALGYDKSHTDFTNGEFDKVLAEFYAVTKPSDLEAQLHQIEQPIERLRELGHQLQDLAAKVVDEPGREKAYVKGLAAKIFPGIEFAALTEPQLQQLAGILRARIAQIKKQNAAMFAPKKQPVGVHAKTAQEAEENPDWMY